MLGGREKLPDKDLLKTESSSGTAEGTAGWHCIIDVLIGGLNGWFFCKHKGLDKNIETC